MPQHFTILLVYAFVPFAREPNYDREAYTSSRIHRERHMKPQSSFTLFTALLGLVSHAATAQKTVAPFSAAAAVEAALSRKGTPQPDGVLKFAFPRSDLSVTVAGTPI